MTHKYVFILAFIPKDPSPYIIIHRRKKRRPFSTTTTTDKENHCLARKEPTNLSPHKEDEKSCCLQRQQQKRTGFLFDLVVIIIPPFSFHNIVIKKLHRSNPTCTERLSVCICNYDVPSVSPPCCSELYDRLDDCICPQQWYVFWTIQSIILL